MRYSRRLGKTVAFLLTAVMLVFAGVIPKAAAADITSKAGRVTTSTGALNVRSNPSTTGTILTQLASGTYVTLMNQTGNWWYVEYAPSAYGYVSADYIQAVSGASTAAVSSSVSMLNVRTGPGATYWITGVITRGQTVLILSQGSGWDKILCNGTLTGYASAAYLIPAATPAPSSAMSWPVPASHKINQYFSSTHEGIDIGASVHGVPGDAVVAAQSGKVVFAGILNGYGYVVYIDSVNNGQPIQTRYAHLNSAPLVAAGTYVSGGQIVGYMGNTGTSSGVHLHFEVRLRNSSADCIANADSTPVNPLDYVK